MLTPFEISILIAIMLLVSVGSYFIIEKPLRRTRLTPLTVKFSLVMALLIIGISWLAIQSSGFKDRFIEQEKFSSLDKMWEWECPNFHQFPSLRREYCTFGGDWEASKRKIIVWGDSHAEQIAPLMRLVAENYNFSVLVIDRSCRPITDGKDVLLRHRQAKKATKGCLEMKRKVYEGISRIKRTIAEVYTYRTAVAGTLSHQFQLISPPIHSEKPCFPLIPA